MQTEVRMQDKFDAGMEAGMKVGMEKERLEMAKRLLKRGLPIVDIAEDSGISVDVLEKLKSEMP